MGVGTFGQQMGKAQQAVAHEQRFGQLTEMVQKNPHAFGGITALSPYLGNFVNQLVLEDQLSPQERVVRTQVLTEAAGLLNEIYGAALSAGENVRALGWVPDEKDISSGRVMEKLQAAMAWQRAKAGSYGVGVENAARGTFAQPQPSAPPPASAPAAPGAPGTQQSPIRVERRNQTIKVPY
jgi:hypothetical protein